VHCSWLAAWAIYEHVSQIYLYGRTDVSVLRAASLWQLANVRLSLRDLIIPGQ
jgi:hypothetical protein